MQKICHRLLLTALFAAGSVWAEEQKFTPGQLEFFEKKIRPLFATHCAECHGGAGKLRGGLRLDSREALLKGGDTGPAIVVGQPDESRLIQFVRHQGKAMPKGKPKLAETQIAALAQWVAQGAAWPAGQPPVVEAYDWAKVGEHWAFQPVKKSKPPSVSGARVRNAIDQFVAARRQKAGLPEPVSASAPVFVRRVFIGLIGLAPSPEELAQWTAKLGGVDANALDSKGVAALIDHLLARPQYGERWARHWLDVARYSDTGGWSQDNRAKPNAWQYRDWVVRAFNEDLPYNDFVRQQIVGDQLGYRAAAGTGFFSLGPTYTSDGGDPDSVAQAKGETLDDRVDTFSRAFLGLTVACARCHDHKFDPIPIQDYYSIAGVFRNTREGEVKLVSEQELAAWHEARKPIDALNKKIGEAKKQKPQTDELKKQIGAWQKEVQEQEKKLRKLPSAHTIHDSGNGDMHVALRGNLLKRGELAPRRFLRIVAGAERAHFKDGSGRRQLAEAVVNPANPLTARVFVNRVWQHHFGHGLVRTPDNFGTLGEKPTHPELLDWLAASFMDSGWSIKQLHRLILTSATYQASSTFNRAAFDRDGDNRLLWRMTPRRMDVEAWRDSLLSVTGELDPASGGPAIDNIAGSKRRTLYAKVSRNAPLSSDTFLRLFDFPIPRATAAQRTANVIPQQFLFMLNSRFMLDRARALAARLEKETPVPTERVARAYSLLFGRAPTAREQAVAATYLAGKPPANGQLNRWQQYCQALLSANEFMYIR